MLPLNPIDSTLINADPKVSAANVDLFIEHGSVPSGDSPQIAMPACGDGKLLTGQQLADIIAYVISLNTGKQCGITDRDNSQAWLQNGRKVSIKVSRFHIADSKFAQHPYLLQPRLLIDPVDF